jgi:hypothetical protein
LSSYQILWPHGLFEIAHSRWSVYSLLPLSPVNDLPEQEGESDKQLIESVLNFYANAQDLAEPLLFRESIASSQLRTYKKTAQTSDSLLSAKRTE